MNSNKISRMSYPIFKMLCRRVSIHDIFDDNEEVPPAVIDESNEDEVLSMNIDQTVDELLHTPAVIDETDDDEDEVSSMNIDQTVEEQLHRPAVIDESNEDQVSSMNMDQTVEEQLHRPAVIDESNEDEVLSMNIDQTVEEQLHTPVVIDETDDDEDEVSTMNMDQTVEEQLHRPVVIDDSDENEISTIVIDETDVEVSTIVIDDSDEDEISTFVIDETDVEVSTIVIDDSDEDFESNTNKNRCSKLRFCKLVTKLEEIVSKIEKLEMVPCDLESGITTEFDDCVKLRLQALEVMNEICKVNGNSLKSKTLDFKNLTKYPEYNFKLKKLFKKSSSLPNFSTSLQYFERCNKKFKYGITNADEMHRVVQAAFGEILITIRERREKEFKESQNCYIAKYDNYETDPAIFDKELEMKLMENRKNGKSIAEAINDFRMKQMPLEFQ